MNPNEQDDAEKEIQAIEEQVSIPIDCSKFEPMSINELTEILGLTVKRDFENKLIGFLCMLSAFTEGSQFNISFNAPSSTGKSYIPMEIAKLFPEEDVVEIGHCSPTAFFHDNGEFVKEKGGYVVDLSRKILIFVDQPHVQLLERLRSLLSHDKKEIQSKITDKSQKFGLKTKNVFLRGFPSVIFCTAGLRIDEQEATRFLLLSPETNQQKIREGINEKIIKESDTKNYKNQLEENPDRILIKERILAIKQANINEINIVSSELVKQLFFQRYGKNIQPRHQRDIGRITSIIKSLALLNLWFRKQEGDQIIANEDDIQQGFMIWDKIAESQELNLPPYVFNMYKEVVLPAWLEKNDLPEGVETLGIDDVATMAGLIRQEILTKYHQITNRYLPDWQLRQQIIPMWETAGLIIQEDDPNDKRRMLIYPAQFNISPKENNSESDGGVKN